LAWPAPSTWPLPAVRSPTCAGGRSPSIRSPRRHCMPASATSSTGVTRIQVLPHGSVGTGAAGRAGHGRRRCDRRGDPRTHGERDDRNGDAIHSARWLGGRRRRHGAASRSSDDAARATGAADAAGRGDRYPRMSFCDSSLTTEDSTEAATPTARYRRDHPGRRRALPQLFTFEVRAVSQVGQALVWLAVGRHERIEQPRVVGRRPVLHRTYTGWL